MNEDLGAHGSDRQLPDSSHALMDHVARVRRLDTEIQVILLAWNGAYDQS
jgi:hypothetical protein